MLFLDTPSYAIINSYVEIAKTKTDKFGANFVNAVLRNIARQKDKLLNNRKSKYFSKEFLKILRQDYSAQEIKDMEEFVNIEPMLDLTFKPDIKPKFTDYIKLDFDTIRLSSNIKVTELDGFGDGDFWVQDASSSMAVKCLSDDLTNKNVLDLCAAPGGKTAQLLSRGAKVNAVDISLPDLNGKNVLVIEDIVDTGHTAKFLVDFINLNFKPKTFKFCSLLDKKCKREVEIDPDYFCFEVEDKFLVGYGLDYDGYYRNIPYIGYVEEV